jgi:hypothetical protein
LENFTFNKDLVEYKSTHVSRAIFHRYDDEVKLPETTKEKISANGIIFYPEFVEYTFHLDGVPRQLLLFLIFHQMNLNHNRFLYNQEVIADFRNYCRLAGGKQPSLETIHKALRKLVAGNMIQNIRKGQYMLNPLLAAGGGISKRKALIQDYSRLLVEKGKDPAAQFYPAFDY